VRRVALLLCGATAFCAAAELRFSLPGDPKTFDPLHVSEGQSELIRYLTAGVLVRINRVTGKVEPELAERYQMSPDGRAITFHLRAGLKFSDGASLTANDVARTMALALDPKQASPKGDTLRSDKGDPVVHVVSPLEITVQYPSPKPDLDRLFDAFSIVPARAEKIPASAGAFHVVEYRPGEFVRMERNPYYWHRPALDSLRADILPNHDIEITRFLRGELHIINKLDPESFDRVVKEKPAAARNLGASLDSELLWFNQAPSATVPEWKRKWFRSTAFRHAISQAIRRDDIARIVFRGHAHPAAGPISPADTFWFNADLKPLPFDEVGAMRALHSDGFRLTDGVLRDSNGHSVEFSIITNAGNRPREAMAAVVQDDLRKIGIRVNIVTLDFGSLIERITKTAQYEACLLGFTSVQTEPTEQMNVWLSFGAQHAWWPMEKSPATPWEARIDQLELAQASDPSRAARKKAMDELQKIVVEQEPIIYLVNPDYLAAISPALKGTQPVAAPPQILWNVESLRIE
jgi:peptide/nickel transport system substrate-binding protein